MATQRSLGKLPTGLNVLKTMRLVCQTGGSNKEYVGVLAKDPATGEYFGGCRWGGIGKPSQDSSVLYRGPNLAAAAAAVDKKLASKVKGRSSSVYEPEDGSTYSGFDTSGIGAAAPGAASSTSSRPATPAKPAYRPRSIAEAMRRR